MVRETTLGRKSDRDLDKLSPNKWLCCTDDNFPVATAASSVLVFTIFDMKYSSAAFFCFRANDVNGHKRSSLRRPRKLTLNV